MKIIYTDHLIDRLKLRKIPKSLAKKVYLNKEAELHDTVKHHRIALSRQELFGRIRFIAREYLHSSIAKFSLLKIKSLGIV